MTVNYTPLLGLAQPVTGTESGTWGDTINASLTALLETAIAGTKTADVTSGNWTLTDIDGADDTARAAVLIPTGTNGATARSILAPNQSKLYVIINQATGSVVIKGVTGPTTGVTIASGKTTMVAWNGSDFVELTPNTIAGILPIVNGGTGTSTPALVAGTNISITGTWPNQTITGPVSTGASIKPSLLLDFANSKTLDPRITFTRASTATYTGYDGLIKTAASGAPRFDFNPTTGESLGLLIEEQRTNLLTYSEQFDNAVWAKLNATVTANATTAPDGTMTADKLVENTSTSSHYVEQAVSVINGTSYTFSVYAKAGERPGILLGCYLGAPFTARFNLSIGIISSTSSGATANITPLNNGWYKCSITMTSAVTGTAWFDYYIDNGTVSSYTGDGTSGIYIWGAQLEAGAFATSYIPTTSAQATRAADNAVMTGTNFSSWYRQDEGTVFAKADSEYSTSSITEQTLFSISDATANNYIKGVRVSATNQFYGTVSGATQFSLNGGTFTTNPSLFGNSYKLNDIAASFNAAAVLTDTVATIPTVTQVGIGNSLGASYLNGHIAKLAYYPKRLTNAELQSITTV